MSSTLVVEPFTFASELPEADRVEMTDIWNGVWAEWIDGERAISVDAYVDIDRLTHEPEVVHRRLVRDGSGRVVGFGQTAWRDGEVGAAVAKVFVSPGHRGTGVGRTLGGSLAGIARSNRRTGMTVEAVEGSTAAAILARSGFRPGMVVEQNRARVAEADDKAVNHLRLRAERPEVELIQTWNASANAPMLRINRALGFRPVQTHRGWYLPFE